MTKKVVRKSASKPSKPEVSENGKRVVTEALISPEANAAQQHRAKEHKPEPAKNVAKVLNLIVSIGDDDSGRNIEKFLSDLKKQMKAVEPPYLDESGKKKPGPHVAMTGAHYILDGVVCQPDDYDEKKRALKRGTFPPAWAGGPTKTGLSMTQQMDFDVVNLTDDQYDFKYKIGKYAPPPPPKPAPRKPEVIEEFEWDEEDMDDTEMHEAVVAKSASASVKKMKGKRVVKRAGTETGDKPPKKKVVKRGKK